VYCRTDFLSNTRGAVPPGQLLSQLARLRGARVIGLDLMPGHLALANELGVSDTLLVSSPDVAEQVLDLRKGRGAEAVIVAVGSPIAELLVFDLVGEGRCVDLFPAPTLRALLP
jgi:threonine dehydrogenase-like Zn-dependent dehydrogenase